MATETLRPMGIGSETTLTPYPDTGEDNWEDVDEAVADRYTTRVQAVNANYLRDLYAVEDSGVGAGTINFIKIYFRHVIAFGTGVNHIKPSLKSNGTVTDGTEISAGSSWVTSSQQWNTNPAPPGTDAWTWADIDALQIGVSIQGDGSYGVICTQVWVEVDYTPVVVAARGWFSKF